MADRSAIEETELDKIHSFAIALAKQAGQMLLDAVELRAGKTVREGHVEKESAVDLVTQADEVSPRVFRTALPATPSSPRNNASVPACKASRRLPA